MITINCAICGKEKRKKPHTVMEKNYCSIACLGKKPKNIPKGEKSKGWKGDEVGYRGLHAWVEKMLGKPSFCEECKTTMPPPGKGIKHPYFHWANLSGKYLRDVSDWRRMCYKCHFAHDKKVLGTKFGHPKGVKGHSASRLKGRWSMKNDRCIKCGTIENKHYGRGICTKCRQISRRTGLPVGRHKSKNIGSRAVPSSVIEP